MSQMGHVWLLLLQGGGLQSSRISYTAAVSSAQPRPWGEEWSGSALGEGWSARFWGEWGSASLLEGRGRLGVPWDRGGVGVPWGGGAREVRWGEGVCGSALGDTHTYIRACTQLQEIPCPTKLLRCWKTC